MPKCNNCGYPWATHNICPNCNSKSPTGSALWILFGVFLIGGGLLLWNGSNYDAAYENIASIPSSSEIYPDENAESNYLLSQNSDVSNDSQVETETFANADQYNYTCRECGTRIKWVGSYHWSCDDKCRLWIQENTDEEVVADNRIDTYMYTEEGRYNRGIFCSQNCSQTNFDNWLVQKN